MDLSLSDEERTKSEGEVFVGPLTLLENEKRFHPLNHHHIMSDPTAITCEDGEPFEPNSLLTNVVSKLSLSPEDNSGWGLKPNDIFLRKEKMVSDLNVDTNDSIDQISKGPHDDMKAIQTMHSQVKEMQNQTEAVLVENLAQNIERYKPTHATNLLVKTPEIAASQINFLTPSTSTSFHQVVRPVEMYIHNSPNVPLVENVTPNKPLVASLDIPKRIESASIANLYDKVTFQLPSIVYKDAKEKEEEKEGEEERDIMVKIPDEGKLPEQLVSSIPKATVIKHGHRVESVKTTLEHHQEGNFGDLSMHQAEVSVCTERSAFNKPKKGV